MNGNHTVAPQLSKNIRREFSFQFASERQRWDTSLAWAYRHETFCQQDLIFASSVLESLPTFAPAATQLLFIHAVCSWIYDAWRSQVFVLWSRCELEDRDCLNIHLRYFCFVTLWTSLTVHCMRKCIVGTPYRPLDPGQLNHMRRLRCAEHIYT